MDFVNGKDDIPYMKWNIRNVWNHQPVGDVIWNSNDLEAKKPWGKQTKTCGKPILQETNILKHIKGKSPLLDQQLVNIAI